MKFSFDAVPKLAGYSIEYVDSRGYLLSKLHKLYIISHSQDRPRYIGKVPVGPVKWLLCQFRIFQRFFRHMYYIVIRMDAGCFVCFGKQVGILNDKGFQPIQTRQSARILRQGAVLAADKNVYWGEYIPNANRADVVIYRLVQSTLTTEIVHTFAAGEIRHVHGLYADPYRQGSIWVATGDRPEECRLLETGNYFKSCTMVWGMDESYRAVSLLFTEDAIYYGTDAEFEQNHLYKVDRLTGVRKKLATLNGPCFYSKKFGKYMLFAVTAELCRSQSDNKAAIYLVDSETDEVSRIFDAEKDLVRSKPPYTTEPLLARLFMYGSIHFSIGDESEHSILISFVGLRGFDNKVVRLKLL
jgi:hypothetical protein